jgi:hypothetical protein
LGSFAAGRPTTAIEQLLLDGKLALGAMESGRQSPGASKMLL